MFIKRGDLQPITVIEPVDVDTKSTKKALDKVKKNISDELQEDKKNNKNKKDIK